MQGHQIPVEIFSERNISVESEPNTVCTCANVIPSVRLRPPIWKISPFSATFLPGVPVTFCVPPFVFELLFLRFVFLLLFLSGSCFYRYFADIFFLANFSSDLSRSLFLCLDNTFFRNGRYPLFIAGPFYFFLVVLSFNVVFLPTFKTTFVLFSFTFFLAAACSIHALWHYHCGS